MGEAVGCPGEAPGHRFNPEGEATAERGDWLVRNRTREIWPMTAVVFAETYGEL